MVVVVGVVVVGVVVVVDVSNLPNTSPHWSVSTGHSQVRFLSSEITHCNTVQYSTVQYSTVQYSTVQHSTVQHSTVQYSTAQYSTVQYSTAQYSTVPVHVVEAVRTLLQLDAARLAAEEPRAGGRVRHRHPGVTS